MTKTNAQWLMNEYWPNRDRQVNAESIKIFTKAINIIRDQNNPIPACSCQWRTNALIAKSLYEQNQSLIETTANAKTRTKSK